MEVTVLDGNMSGLVWIMGSLDNVKQFQVFEKSALGIIYPIL